MAAASTFVWSTMTTAQGLNFAAADVLSFDAGAGAAEVVVSIGPSLTTLSFAGKSLQFLDAALTGDAGQFQFGDGSHLGVDGQNGGSATFTGGSGPDQFQAQNQPADGTRTDIVFGAGGTDIIGGGDGDDMLFAGATPSAAGDGLPGQAVINGQLGDDCVVGNGGADTLFGGQGADSLFGNGGDDSMNGNLGDDVMYGGGGADSMFGGQNNDILDGGAGNDSISGDVGDDTVAGGDGSDSLFGAGGDDSLAGGAGDDSLSGGLGNDTLDGGAGSDSVYGGQGDDSLISTGGTAGAAGDYLAGDLGDDTIRGGLGTDTLAGGSGADLLIESDATGSPFSNDGSRSDVVVGFTSGQDHLQLATQGGKISYDALPGSFSTYVQAAAAAGTAAQGFLGRVVMAAQVGGDTYLFVDTDGNHVFNGSDEVIKLAGVGVGSVHAGDFLAG